MIDIHSPELTEAVLIWTGWETNIMPRRDETFLVERFGIAKTTCLLTTIRSLEDDFYSSDAKITASNLQEMADKASIHFLNRHPGAPAEIVKALAWCYTFDFK